MNDGEIFQSTKFVLQGLDTLKNEHEKLLENIAHSSNILISNETEEKLFLLRKSMETIDSGLLNTRKESLDCAFFSLRRNG